jgi:hypothetical protein
MFTQRPVSARRGHARQVSFGASNVRRRPRREPPELTAQGKPQHLLSERARLVAKAFWGFQFATSSPKLLSERSIYNANAASGLAHNSFP